jgi:glyoxylase-like metal-dependent hydrolase (beta-lactamase superfamily II)
MPSTIIKKVYVLDGGLLTLEASTLTSGLRQGEQVDVPVALYLLETSLGYILVDTGNDPEVIGDPVATWGKELADFVWPTMSEANHPAVQLGLVGVAPSDVRLVIYTHLHHDHAGGARLFPQAVHVVQASELRWAYAPDRYARRGYLRSDFDHGLRWLGVEGDVALLPGVQLIHTPGHSPGHQSIMLDVPEAGTVIVCGDSVNTRDNVRLDVAPGITVSAAEAVVSIHRLIAMASWHDALLLPSHDLEFWGLLPKAPNPLAIVPASQREFWLEGMRRLYGESLMPSALMAKERPDVSLAARKGVPAGQRK